MTEKRQIDTNALNLLEDASMKDMPKAGTTHIKDSLARLPKEMIAQDGAQSKTPIVFFQQNNTTKIERSNIEWLSLDQRSQEPHEMSNPTKWSTVQKDMIGVENPQDCTWLSQNIVMFNKRRISPQSNSKVYQGRQAIYGQYRDIAVKLIQHSEKSVKEVETIMNLTHPYVVEIYGAGEYNGGGHWIYIAMELCSKNLEQYVHDSPHDPLRSFEFLKQIIDAVDYMHKSNIAHRDIKPTNILISQCGSCIKFSDFGVSKEIPSQQTSLTDSYAGAGTEGFKAPELYDTGCKVSMRSDIFALGIVMAYLLTNGKHPYGDKAHDWGYKIRNNEPYDLSLIPHETPKRQQLIELLKRMILHEPRDRPTMRQITQELSPIAATVSLPATSAPLAIASPFTTLGDGGDHDKQTDFHSISEDQTQNSNPEQFDRVSKGVNDEVVGEQLRLPIRRRRQSSPEYGAKRQFNHRSAIAVFDGYSGRVLCYDPKTRAVSQMQEFHNDMKKSSYFKANIIGQCLYVTVPNGQFYSLDYLHEAAIWKEQSKRPSCHGYASSDIVASGRLILIGGVDKKSASMYNPETDEWKRLPDKNNATTGCTVVAVNDIIYCLGGNEGGVITKLAEAMHLQTTEWQQLLPLEIRISNAVAQDYREKIVLVGGSRIPPISGTPLDIYDPKLNQCTKLRSMSGISFYGTILVIDDRIFFPPNGNWPTRNGRKCIGEYNIQEESWRDIDIEYEEIHVKATSLIFIRV